MLLRSFVVLAAALTLLVPSVGAAGTLKTEIREDGRALRHEVRREARRLRRHEYWLHHDRPAPAPRARPQVRQRRAAPHRHPTHH